MERFRLKPFACEDCEQRFDSSKLLRLHVAQHKWGPHRIISSPAGTRFQCLQEGCNKVVSDRKVLRKHLLTHQPRQFVCQHEGCGKKFYERAKLKRHFLVHTGEKSFSCPFEDCGKQFAYKANLKTHIRTHTGHRPFVCTVPGCTKSFAQASNRNSHVLTHANSKRKREKFKIMEAKIYQKHKNDKDSAKVNPDIPKETGASDKATKTNINLSKDSGSASKMISSSSSSSSSKTDKKPNEGIKCDTTAIQQVLPGVSPTSRETLSSLLMLQKSEGNQSGASSSGSNLSNNIMPAVPTVVYLPKVLPHAGVNALNFGMPMNNPFLMLPQNQMNFYSSMGYNFNNNSSQMNLPSREDSNNINAVSTASTSFSPKVFPVGIDAESKNRVSGGKSSKKNRSEEEEVKEEST